MKGMDLRWVSDVVYHEDACRVHDSNAAESLAVMRRLAFNIAKQETTQKRSMKAKYSGHYSVMSIGN